MQHSHNLASHLPRTPALQQPVRATPSPSIRASGPAASTLQKLCSVFRGAMHAVYLYAIAHLLQQYALLQQACQPACVWACAQRVGVGDRRLRDGMTASELLARVTGGKGCKGEPCGPA